MKLYVASSWRNERQPGVVQFLRECGHEVYDFRNPAPGNNGFHWSEIDPQWKSWTPHAFVRSLDHPIAERGFGCDFAAMQAAEGCVLAMPCGRSAHLEAGWFAGSDRPLWILLDGRPNAAMEPELMYKMATDVVVTFCALANAIERWNCERSLCFASTTQRTKGTA